MWSGPKADHKWKGREVTQRRRGTPSDEVNHFWDVGKKTDNYKKRVAVIAEVTGESRGSREGEVSNGDGQVMRDDGAAAGHKSRVNSWLHTLTIAAGSEETMAEKKSSIFFFYISNSTIDNTV